MNPLLQTKPEQANQALDEARSLLTEGAELKFVINGIYYAFPYPVFGLLQVRKIAAPMQSTAIALFEREFVGTGAFDQRFMEAIRRAFELRPSCQCQAPKKITREDTEQLLLTAGEFLDRVRAIAD